MTKLRAIYPDFKMANFRINALSATRQCSSSADVYEVLAGLVECFEYILPSLGKNLHELQFDPWLEQRELRAGEAFSASINNMPTGSDREKSIRRLWFVCSRNRSVQLDWEPSTEVVISAPSTQATLQGAVADIAFENATKFFSFGGSDITKAAQLLIERSGGNISTYDNFCNAETLRHFLPLYSASPKHKSKGYTDSSGDYVSPMSLPPDQAQSLLLLGLPDGDDYIALHEQTNVFYRFKVTGGNVYHGFEVSESEVSMHIQARLRKRR